MSWMGFVKTDKMEKPIYELGKVIKQLKNIRDYQEAIPCMEHYCLCNFFDLIIDDVEELQKIFIKARDDQ